MIPSFGEGVGRKLQLDALLIYESTRPYPFWKMNHELCLVTQNTVGMVPKLLYNFQLPHYPFEGLHDISWLNLGVSHLKESTVFHRRRGPFPTSVEDTHPSAVYRQRYGFRLREQRSDAILCKKIKFDLCEFLVDPSIIEDFFPTMMAWTPKPVPKWDRMASPIHVTLLSGRGCSLYLESTATMEEVKLAAQEALQQPFLQLVPDDANVPELEKNWSDRGDWGKWKENARIPECDSFQKFLMILPPFVDRTTFWLTRTLFWADRIKRA